MAFQSSLFAATRTMPDFDLLTRHDLGSGAWVETCPGWLPEPDDVFETLHEVAPWRSGRRPMYDRVVDVPRLTASYGCGQRLPHPVLEEARRSLDEHYGPLAGGRFETAGCCLYRDGRDSVAWHGDRLGRGRSTDVVVAIVSVGATRHLALRPRGGGASMRFEVGHGDLFVMGGSCQRTFDHAVPKVGSAGPRISIQFRPAGVV